MVIDPTDLDNRYYTKDEIHEIISGANFDFFLNDTASDIANYSTMQVDETGEAESSDNATVTGDATLIEEYATPSGEPTFTTLSTGSYEFHFHASTTTGANIGTVRVYYELYKRTSGGTETLLLTSEESDVLTNTKTSYSIHAIITTDVDLLTTDRLVLKVYANIETSRPADPVATIYMEGTTATRFSVKTTIAAFDERYAPIGAHYVTTQSDGNLANEHLTSALDVDLVWDADDTRNIGSATKGTADIFITGGLRTTTAQDGFHIKKGDGTLIFAIGTGTGTGMYIAPSTNATGGLGSTGAFWNRAYIQSIGDVSSASSEIYSRELYSVNMTQGSVLFTGADGLISQDNANLFWDDINNRLGIGTNSPSSILHIKANTPGTVGSHPAGQLIIQDPDDTVFGNVAITGYESDGAGNPDQQLWYLGSSSGSNTDIIFLNRRNANLHLGTNGLTRLTILGNGNVGIGVSPNQLLTIEGIMSLREKAAAGANTAAYGQIWVKTATPNQLWFTDDGGNDVQLGVGGAVANHTHDKHTDQTREIYISTAEMHADSSAPPLWSRLTGTRADGWEHDFIAAKNIQCDTRVDSDFVSGVTFFVYWVQLDPPAGSPENWVCVQDATAITPGTDTYDSPAGELNTQTITAEATLGQLNRTQLTNTLTVPAAGEVIKIRLGRDPANFNDNYNNSIWIVGLGVQFTRAF